MNRPIPNGLLVAIEGIDGAGKTSVATLLAQWCGERGLGCVISKEPTGNKWGQELRNSAKEGRLTIEEELRLLELDRRDHVERSIQPALDEGNIVILDRYYWSSAAYQGVRGFDHLEIVEKNEEFAPRPDLFVVLDLEVDAGLQRIRMRGDTPNHFEGKGSLIRARQIFNQLAEQSAHAIIVESSGHLKDTFPKVLKSFLTTAVNKVAAAKDLSPEMVNQTLVLLGEEPMPGLMKEVVDTEEPAKAGGESD